MLRTMLSAAFTVGLFLVQGIMASINSNMNILAHTHANRQLYVPPTTFNMTAISANSKRESVLECWQLSSHFQPLGRLTAL